MTDTPERITVSFKNWRNPNVGACYKNDAGDTGYVREDLHKALTAERDRFQRAFAAQSAKVQIALDVGGEPVRAALLQYGDEKARAELEGEK